MQGCKINHLDVEKKIKREFSSFYSNVVSKKKFFGFNESFISEAHRTACPMGRREN